MSFVSNFLTTAICTWIWKGKITSVLQQARQFLLQNSWSFYPFEPLHYLPAVNICLHPCNFPSQKCTVLTTLLNKLNLWKLKDMQKLQQQIEWRRKKSIEEFCQLYNWVPQIGFSLNFFCNFPYMWLQFCNSVLL